VDGAESLPAGVASRLTHIIGADVVYAGGADGVLMQESTAGGSPRVGLATTLDRLCNIDR